jgi:hypothetical protein
MHGFFVPVALAAVLAGCGAGQPKPAPRGEPHGSEAVPGAAPVMGAGAQAPENCDDFAARVQAAPAGEPEERASAVFAQAECEHARLAATTLDAGGRADYETRLAAVAGLYAEVAESGLDKWVIGAWVRTGDLYRAAAAAAEKAALGDAVRAWQVEARKAYEAGLGRADAVSKDVRFDVEVADWIKAGCKGLGAAGVGSGGVAKKFKVCSPWKESWR